jgi:hypothetical protein
MLVYYLVYIRPFVDYLRSTNVELIPANSANYTPFLWASADYRDCWSTAKLTNQLCLAGNQYMQAPWLNTKAYRHISITISRKHLQTGGFYISFSKRNTIADRQAGHDEETADAIYGVLLGQGSNWIQPLIQAYKQLSLAWHKWLEYPGYEAEPIAAESDPVNPDLLQDLLDAATDPETDDDDEPEITTAAGLAAGKQPIITRLAE